MIIRWKSYKKSKTFKTRGSKIVIFFLCLDRPRNVKELANILNVNWIENIRRIVRNLHRENLVEVIQGEPMLYKANLNQLAKEIREYYEKYLSNASKMKNIDERFLLSLKNIIKYKDSKLIEIFRNAFEKLGKNLYFDPDFLRRPVDNSSPSPSIKIAELRNL